MSTATTTVSITGTIDGIQVNETATFVTTINKATQFVRDIAATEDAITTAAFVQCIVKNIGDNVLCIRVGEANFAVPPDKVGVIPGSTGNIDGGTGDVTLETPLGLYAQSLKGTTRARFTFIY